MKEKKTLRSFATHNGSFHADEVTACALLLHCNLIDEDKLVRTRDLEQIKQCEYICDVGGIYDPEKKWFDHHQADYDGELSSAGMVLLYLKERKILSEREYTMFNESLILGVDAHDNGRCAQMKGLCTYSQIIANFRPIQYAHSQEEENQAFFEALHFAVEQIARMRQRYHYTQSCKVYVQERMQQGEECLIFDKEIPWQDSFFELNGARHPAKFVIIPSGKHWNLRGIPPTSENRLTVRCPHPKAWAGLLAGDLQKATGISGAIFCHKGRFISVWETQEDAIKALQLCLHKNQH